MRTICTLIFVRLAIFNDCLGQTTQSVGIGVGVKQDKSKATKEVVLLLENYFQLEGHSTEQRLFISQKDKEHFVFPNHLLSQAQSSSLYNNPLYYKPTILSVIDEDSCQIANIAFAHCEPTGHSNLVKILKVVINKECEAKRLSNSIFYNLSRYKWKRTYTKNTTVYSTPSLIVNNLEIDSLIQFSHSVADKLRVPPLHFSYFVANSFEEIQQIRGVVYENRFYNTAIAEPFNKLFYVGNGSFFYPHELVHLYTYQTFQNGNFHNFFDEGLATYWGGSANKPLNYHLKKVKIYAVGHESTLWGDINAIQDVVIDSETNAYYAIGGLICKMVYEQRGFLGLKTLFDAGMEDTNVYEAIETTLGVKRQDLDAFLRKELEKY